VEVPTPPRCPLDTWAFPLLAPFSVLSTASYWYVTAPILAAASLLNNPSSLLAGRRSTVCAGYLQEVSACHNTVAPSPQPHGCRPANPRPNMCVAVLAWEPASTLTNASSSSVLCHRHQTKRVAPWPTACTACSATMSSGWTGLSPGTTRFGTAIGRLNIIPIKSLTRHCATAGVMSPPRQPAAPAAHNTSGKGDSIRGAVVCRQPSAANLHQAAGGDVRAQLAG